MSIKYVVEIKRPNRVAIWLGMDASIVDSLPLAGRFPTKKDAIYVAHKSRRDHLHGKEAVFKVVRCHVKMVTELDGEKIEFIDTTRIPESGWFR